MAPDRKISESQSPPGHSSGPPSDSLTPANGTDEWIRRSLNNIDRQLENASERFEKVDARINERFDKLDERLRSIETKTNYAIGGIAVAVVFFGVVGWMLRPVVLVVAELLISGGS